MTSVNRLQISLTDTKLSLEEVNTQLEKISGREEKYRKSLNSNTSPLLGRHNRTQNLNKRAFDEVFHKNEGPSDKRMKYNNIQKHRQVPKLEDSEILKVSEKPQRAVTDDDVTIERNRRMFGNIMTTLKQFQVTQVQSSNSSKEQRRREIAHKLEREDQEERLGAANERRELIQNKQQMEKQILCFEEKIEVEKMNSVWDAHTDKLSNFIQTKSKPHMFYLPKRHNKTTQHLLTTTKSKLNAQKQARRRKFDEIIDTKFSISSKKDIKHKPSKK